MKTAKSTRRPNKKVAKPRKPYTDFPLFSHATKRWAKKIRGKLHYFGPWNDPDGALRKYLDQRDDLHAGREPRSTEGELTIRDLANRFLTAKKQLLDAGEITNPTFLDYHSTCGRIVRVFGRTRLVEDLASKDFEKLRADIQKNCGPVAIGNDIGAGMNTARVFGCPERRRTGRGLFARPRRAWPARETLPGSSPAGSGGSSACWGPWPARRHSADRARST